MRLDMGLANCPRCGTQIGTLFSEANVVPEDTRARLRKNLNRQISLYEKLEKAQERANNALILALASFFCPGLGFIMGTASIVIGTRATRVLRENNIEEGRGSATAGVVIGFLGIVAQVCYVLYVMKMGLTLPS
jgi:uncharacterized protein DUF4190